MPIGPKINVFTCQHVFGKQISAGDDSYIV